MFITVFLLFSSQCVGGLLTRLCSSLIVQLFVKDEPALPQFYPTSYFVGDIPENVPPSPVVSYPHILLAQLCHCDPLHSLCLMFAADGVRQSEHRRPRKHHDYLQRAVWLSV